jgi:glutathione reductase (NADPH)
VAIAEGRAVAEALFNRQSLRVDYSQVPTAVFSQPPVSTVGLTEAEARELYAAVDVYATKFRPMKYTLARREERTFIKLIVDRESQRVLGCHMVGPDAPEIIQGMAVALRCGATKQQLDATRGIHPTAAEELVTLRERRPDPATPKAPGAS